MPSKNKSLETLRSDTSMTELPKRTKRRSNTSYRSTGTTRTFSDTPPRRSSWLFTFHGRLDM